MPDPPPDSIDRNWLSTFRSTSNLIGQFITQTAQEWLYSLLNQPTTPPFKYNADFNNELGRVVRLIVAVLFISSVLLGGVNLLSKEIVLSLNEHLITTLKTTLTIFIIAVIIALIYTPILFICGVRICSQNTDSESHTEKKPLKVGQVFYTIVYTFVPWLPIIVFIKNSALAAAQSGNVRLFQVLIFFAPVICFAYMLTNLAKSIRLITNCNWARIYLSLVVPTLLLVFANFIL